MSVGQLTVGVVLSLIDRFSPGLDQAESRLGAWSTGLAKLGTVATAGGMASANMSGAAQGALQQIGGELATFDDALATLRSLPEASDAVVGALGQQARAWRTLHDDGLEQYLGAAYAVRSGGAAWENVAAVTETAMLVAKATLGEGREAATLLGTAYANMGNQSEDAKTEIGRLGDVITATQQTFQFGNLGQLSEGLKYAMPAAQAARLEFGALNAAVGRLNTAGLQGSMAGTALAAMLAGLPAAADEFGFAVARTETGALDLAGTVQALVAKLGPLDQAGDDVHAAMRKAFGQEGYRAVMGLGLAVGSLDEDLRVVTDSFGAAGSAAATIDQGLGAQYRIAANNFAEARLVLGDALAPALGQFAAMLRSGAQSLGGWMQAYPGLAKTAAGVLLVAAAVSPLLLGFGTLALTGSAVLRMVTLIGPAAGGVAAVLRGTGMAAMLAGQGLRTGLMAGVMGVRALSVALLTNPIGLAIAGIAGAAMLIYKYWEPLSGFFRGLWSGLTEGLAPVGAAIGAALAPLAEMAQRWLAPLGALLAPVGSWFASAFAPVAAVLASPIAALRDLWAWVTNILTPVQDVGGAAESMGQRWGLAIAGMIGKAAELVGAFAGLAGRFARIGADIVQGLISGFVAKWGALKAKVSELAGGIVSTAKGALGIKSPSTVFAEIGRYAVQGIEVGLGAREPALLDRMRETAARFAAVPLLAGAVGVAAMPGLPAMAPAAVPAAPGANPALRIDDPASAARDERRASWLRDARAQSDVSPSRMALMGLRDRQTAPPVAQMMSAGEGGPAGGRSQGAPAAMRGGAPSVSVPISITITAPAGVDAKQLAALVRVEVEKAARDAGRRISGALYDQPDDM